MTRPFILGITGSIGMGKSAVAAMFAGAGVPVFDADAEVRKLQGPRGELLPAIEAAFPGSTGVDGVDREALGANVFGDPDALARLEAIVHPAVRTESARRFQMAFDADPDAVVVYDLATRKEIGTAQGPPQVGSTLSVSPDGAFLWVNAHDACSAPAYDHAGCPSVPAALVNVYDTATLRPVRSA